MDSSSFIEYKDNRMNDLMIGEIVTFLESLHVKWGIEHCTYEDEHQVIELNFLGEDE
tara:strand:- start:4716 stop:4886 length:171 start_codon:yes stop_codon:yes gene_type:complete